MARATKAARVLLAPTANAVGGTTISATWDLRTTLGGVVQARVTNSGGAVTTGCECAVQVSLDGTTWRDFARQAAGLAAGGVFDFAVELPAPVLYAQVVFSGNVGQPVTVEAGGHELSAVG